MTTLGGTGRYSAPESAPPPWWVVAIVVVLLLLVIARGELGGGW
jgi:hypothetical protein